MRNESTVMAQSGENDVNSLQQQDNSSPHDIRATSTSSTIHRPYTRQPLWQNQSREYQHVSSGECGTGEGADEEYKHHVEARGLGLSNLPKCATSSVIRRVPVGSKGSPQPFSQATTARNTEDINSGNNRWKTDT